jgi:acyl carrier protein
MIPRENARAAVIEELSMAAKEDLEHLLDSAEIAMAVPIDSLSLLDVFLRIEERLGVEIDEETLSRVRTVGDLVACVMESSPSEPGG